MGLSFLRPQLPTVGVQISHRDSLATEAAESCLCSLPFMRVVDHRRWLSIVYVYSSLIIHYFHYTTDLGKERVFMPSKTTRAHTQTTHIQVRNCNKKNHVRYDTFFFMCETNILHHLFWNGETQNGDSKYWIMMEEVSSELSHNSPLLYDA